MIYQHAIVVAANKISANESIPLSSALTSVPLKSMIFMNFFKKSVISVHLGLWSDMLTSSKRGFIQTLEQVWLRVKVFTLNIQRS